ncbi:aldo-keto reductase family [Fusarium longipes]|uniref:Aldo-keto reductase family n=1 Tax=Fusarium longipes TaxID=694270 RepID=A0A395T0P2_9HYPO|nr:aldo-keto reductase family [Fusarium longipes]
MALHSESPYVGLPSFEQKGLTALVAGANGISGQHMLRVLAKHPDRWSKIYALSRRPPQGLFDAPHIQSVALDFLSGTDNIRKTLKANSITKVDYVFFFAYKESSGSGELWGGQEQMVQENGQMLEDFIHAMDGISIKRIILQTGAKNYGVHIGPTLMPSREDDPRVLSLPNFYYRQEDILKELGPRYGFTYSVVRPSHTIGAVQGNTMNLAIDTFSSARMNAYIEEWCALTPEAANEAFNAVNGDIPTWRRTFTDLASYWNIPLDEEQFNKSAPFPTYAESEHAAPDGSGRRGKFELRCSLVEWAKQPRVLDAWERIAKREGLDPAIFHSASWPFGDGVLSFQHQLVLDASKVRSFGFFGYVESVQDFITVFELAAELKLLPRPKSSKS